MSIKYGIKRLFKPLAEFMRKVTYKLMRNVVCDLEETIRFSSGGNENDYLIPYQEGELIRVLFLFQAASFWPSWESFYLACKDDPRIRVEFTLLDELYGDTTQMLTAQQFLKEKGIAYTPYSDKLFCQFMPHITVMQTPYDFGHRRPHVRSAAFKKKGTRIIYIPYGIELSDTAHARDAHFLNAVVKNAWRVFTFSESIRADYRRYSTNYAAVKCLGHPKFDALYHKEQFSQLPEIAQRAKGRKILVWHVHFPKITPQPDGTGIMVTPELPVYLRFARYLASKQDEIFAVLLPHPKFLDGEGELGVHAKKLVDMLGEMENAYIDWSDDYRPTILHGDFLITDRSALMVEADVTGYPILFMANKDYYEPLTDAVQPIIDSYYQGLTTEDMIAFTEQCLRGEDPRKAERRAAFESHIPYFDGQSGQRIKEHVVNAIYAEQTGLDAARIAALEAEVAALNSRLDRLLEEHGQ